jgi:hypothetical protein
MAVITQMSFLPRQSRAPASQDLMHLKSQESELRKVTNSKQLSGFAQKHNLNEYFLEGILESEVVDDFMKSHHFERFFYLK